MRLFGSRRSSKSTRHLLAEILRTQRFLIDRANLEEHGIALPADAHPWWTGRWEIIDLALDELMSYELMQTCGRVVPLSETPLFQYLKTNDETHLRRYIELHDQLNGRLTKACYETHRRALEELRATLRHEPYSPGKRIIVVDGRNAILDGTHRASCLLAQGNGKQKITVLRIPSSDPPSKGMS